MTGGREGRVRAVVLAAGESRRMGEGRQKLLMEVGGQTMIEQVVAAAVESRAGQVGPVIVVTGTHHDRLEELFHAASGVRLVRNPDPSRGMLSSVRCGLEAVGTEAEGVAVLIGDQPGINSAMIDAVVESWGRVEASIAVPTYGGRRGHPLVFDLKYCEEVFTRFDEEGLRGLLAAHPGEVLEVPVESRVVLEDIDTPEDYDRAVGGK